MIELRPIRFDANATADYAALFGACFPDASKFNVAYLKWLYAENPNGQAVGFDAWDGDTLAAHYVVVPLRARLEGLEARVLLSLNTATHPRYQGKGLFTKLADRTYEEAARLGFSAVIGVANANSTPGFTRKLGFQLVEPLAARIGMGSIRMPGPSSATPQFHTIWPREAVAWRCRNPNNPASVRVQDSMVQVYARGANDMLQAYAELPRDRLDATGVPPAAKPLSPFRLYLGLEPGPRRTSLYVDIPVRLRPSPLNFIYRPLATSVQRVDKGSVSFSFIDFDAY